MKTRSLMLTALIACLLFSLPGSLNAQFDDPDPDPPTSAPFDGGLSMLIAAGVGYASKKAYDKRKKQQEEALQQELK